MQSVLGRCIGFITVASWVVEAQGATRIELATHKLGRIPADDDNDPRATVMQKNLVKTSHHASPTSCNDRRGQVNVAKENGKAIPRERKNSSLEDAGNAAWTSVLGIWNRLKSTVLIYRYWPGPHIHLCKSTLIHAQCNLR